MNSARSSLVAAAALGGMLCLPGAAQAAVGAFATGNVNMRTCGSTSCPRIATVPAGAPVTIYGCTEGYRWCDTQYGSYRGWVSGRYLQSMAPGYAQASPLPAVGALLGIAILGAAIVNNNYYYPNWGYWGPGYWPGYWRPTPGWRPGYPPHYGSPGMPRSPSGGGTAFGMPRGGGFPGGGGIPMPGGGGMPGR